MNHDEYLPLSQHQLLGTQECGEARDRVLGLQEHWTRRGGDEFFTLGAASYLDGPRGRPEYLATAQVTNPLLHAAFAGLLTRVTQFFADLLGATVRCSEQYAVPGFHVFVLNGADRSADDVAARAHFDLQWLHILQGQVPLATLSFTLPIEIPCGGASMYIWHARYADAAKLGISARRYASSHRPQVLAYTHGRIVVHDGYILHGIGSALVPTPRGYRMTLQGHGVCLQKNEWILYW